jgi:putative aldouronate transport system substrate-binding protein
MTSAGDAGLGAEPRVRELNRRDFIRAAGGAFTGVGLPLLLAACGRGISPAVPAGATTGGTPATTSGTPATTSGTPATTSGTPGAGGTVRAASLLPTYAPAPNSPKPDFASTGLQYQDGYSYYPKNPIKSWTREPPGLGGKVQSFDSHGSQVPPTVVDQNPAWQEVNKQLNADMQLSSGDGTKLAAIMASGDLPDIITFNGGITGFALRAVANLPQFVEAAMADLTPYLSGDAVKDYPNLAAIPTFAWKNSGCAFNGKLYTWPLERYLPTAGIIRNADIYDQEIGANYVPKNADDLKRILQQLNRPTENRWAWGGSGLAQEMANFATIFGTPNSWGLDSAGKLVKDFETPQYREMVAYWRDLFVAGVIYPDAYTKSVVGAGGFLAARTVMAGTVFGITWTDLWSLSRRLQPPPTFLPLPPFAAHDGQKPVHFLGPGFNQTVGLKKAAPERIKELLRIVDWLAAPFGTAEDLLLTYGVPGTDYDIDANGTPSATSRSNSDALGVGWRYLVQHPQVMNYPGWPDYAKLAYDYEHTVIPMGIEDASWGLLSTTNSSKGAVLQQGFLDGLQGIVMGQRPIGDLDQIVKEWQTGGGNQIRAEFQQALAAAA